MADLAIGNGQFDNELQAFTFDNAKFDAGILEEPSNIEDTSVAFSYLMALTESSDSLIEGGPVQLKTLNEAVSAADSVQLDFNKVFPFLNIGREYITVTYERTYSHI